MRPPDNKRAAPTEDRAALEKGSLAGGTGVKPSGGRPAAQGNHVERNPCQRAPSYAPPEGWHAADLLDSLWRRRR